MKEYYLLEIDDAVAALQSKDEEIEKLRALLKECGEHICFQLCENRAKHLITRINAALGESEE